MELYEGFVKQKIYFINIAQWDKQTSCLFFFNLKQTDQLFAKVEVEVGLSGGKVKATFFGAQ